MNMKKCLFMIALCVGFVACSNDKSKKDEKKVDVKKNVVEVLYFHSPQRCATCMAIEENSKELIEREFVEQLQKGDLVFQSIDLTQNEALANKYEVAWSSLILVDYDANSKESVRNLTDFAFANALRNSEGFKKGLHQEIVKMLNN